MGRKTRMGLGFLLGTICGAGILHVVMTITSSNNSVKDVKKNKFIEPAVVKKSTRKKRQWGIVFPIHGADGPEGKTRARIANASWYSLCRAIKAQPTDTFNVLVVDDKGGKESGFRRDSNFVRYVGRTGFDDASTRAWEADWRVRCGSNVLETAIKLNIKQCFTQLAHNLHTTCTENALNCTEFRCGTSNLGALKRVQGWHDINKNMLRGYRWAAQYDYIMNADSDLFFVPDYFSKILRDHRKRKETCEYPILSGYSSRLYVLVFGANYVFDQETYRVVVGPSIEHRIPWDDAISEEHTRW